MIELVLAFYFDIHTVFVLFGKGSKIFFITEMLQYCLGVYFSCLVVLLYFEWSVIIFHRISHFLSD